MSKYKTFSDYYKEDSDFKEKHLNKMKEKILCECGFETARANLYRHRKSHIHIEKMERINRIKELEEELKRLKQ
jgi:hypothetical protein